MYLFHPVAWPAVFTAVTCILYLVGVAKSANCELAFRVYCSRNVRIDCIRQLHITDLDSFTQLHQGSVEEADSLEPCFTIGNKLII